MNFLKRAAPWMITLVILLSAYVATYVWYYKPNQLTGSIIVGFGSGSIHMPLKKTKNTLLDQFYMPLRLCEEERTKQKARKELLRQCQGEWEGNVRPRSEDLLIFRSYIRVRATIQADQFTITWAESRPELVGVTWKIGCEYDAYPRYGISSNKEYPMNSSIFLAFRRSTDGRELLYDAFVLEWAAWSAQYFKLKRPTTPVTTPTNYNPQRHR